MRDCKVIICGDGRNLAKENIKALSVEESIRANERAKVIGLLYETNMNCHNCHCNDECNFSKADCIEFLSKYISEMLGK